MSNPLHTMVERQARSGSAVRLRHSRWLLSLPFFVLLFVYLWRVIDPGLIYYAAGMVSDLPAFFRGAAFFRSFTAYPGGLAEYIGAFLAQWFYFPWAGALVIALQAFLLTVCAGIILDAAGASRFHWVHFAFPIGLLIVSSHYAYLFAATTALTLALAFVCLYIAIASRLRPLGAALAFLALSACVYYAAGGSYLLFAVLCAIYERHRTRWALTAIYLSSAAGVPHVVGVLLFRVSPTMAFALGLPLWTRTGFAMPDEVFSVTMAALFLVLPAALLLDALARLALHHRSSAKPKKHHRTGRSPAHALASAWAQKPLLRWTAGFVILLVATAAATVSCDGTRKATFQVHRHACERKWPEVLRVARNAALSVSTINAVDRALYHTGRLGSDMFAWPQRPEALLVSGQDQDMTFWTKFDTQLDLGLINMAHKNYTECLEIYGPHPLILKRLALANLAKGHLDAAHIYLGALSKTLFHARWACDYLARLADDPTLTTDERIAQLRSVCMEADFPTVFVPAERQFQTLLNENEHNRMAFEYLMSSYMLTRELDKFVANLGRVHTFGYGPFPRHYEEAILVYAYTKRQPVFLHGREIDPRLKQNIERFSRTFNRYGKNKQAALRELAAGYGDSYFFFNLYGLSGVKR